MSCRRLFAAFALLLPALLTAQPFDLRLTPVATGLSGVVDIVNAGDGSGRLFLVQQSGPVRVLQDGAVRAAPLIDLADRINASGGEQGLLSLAFDPRYPASPYIFAWYVTADAPATVLVRFRVDPATLVADPASAEELLRIAQPFENHNGGKVLFGPDDMLYLSTGDGGGSGDPARSAQDLGSLLGKMLRLDVRALPYSIPAGNPFAASTGARAEIWSYGLRNPWRVSFDRATGELYIADVGQARREEINRQPAGVGGQNWGWSCLEGTLGFTGGDSCRGTAPVPPIAEYSRVEGCSITGGYVYRGTAYPALQGIYFAGDYCSGRIFGLGSGSNAFALTTLIDTAYSISTFGEDEAGNLYIADYFSGVYLLSDGEPQSTTPLDPSQIGSQYWITGNGSMVGRMLVAELSSATGTGFGGAFDPAAVKRKRWGALEIEFTGCDAAQLRWTSSGPDSAGFGDGGYALERIAPSPASQRCHQVGFSAATDLEWVTGTWFGGTTRNGEGLFLERLANGMVLVAFFTHRPPAP